MGVFLIAFTELSTRVRLAAALGRDYSVVAATSPDEALAILDAGLSPNFVVVGLSADWTPAHQAIRGHASPRTGIVIAVSEFSSAVTLAHGDHVYVESGAPSPHRLRILAQRYVHDARSGPHLTVPDVVQMAALGGHTLRISCFEGSNSVGFIDVVEGALWSARDRDSEGRDALHRLLRPGLHAAAGTLVAPSVRSFENLDWREVLLDGARLADESTFETDYEGLIRGASAALLDREHARAAELFNQARRLRPDDPLVIVNLKRLEALGHFTSEDT